MLRKQQFLDLKFAYDILRKPNDRHHYDAVGKVYPSNKSASGAKRTRQNYYSNYSESYSEWGKFYTGQGKDNGQASYQDIQKKNSEQWKRVLIFSGIGFGLVFLYNFGYFLMLVARENKIRKLSAREEIARSFLRQPDYKVSSNDKEELDRFGKILLDDIEEAYNRNILDHRIHNTKEIREEGRWFDYLKADNWIPRTAYDKREVENIKKDN
uniref:J domain-containing protein n=1 Tax=Rhabditophanes sp. KR3021 TaxID=114890 RepID=A0AC35U8F5_9BILA